jgi:hypothetical protein
MDNEIATKVMNQAIKKYDTTHVLQAEEGPESEIKVDKIDWVDSDSIIETDTGYWAPAMVWVEKSEL